jgi:hypothetical protein
MRRGGVDPREFLENNQRRIVCKQIDVCGQLESKSSTLSVHLDKFLFESSLTATIIIIVRRVTKKLGRGGEIISVPFNL